MDAHEYFRVLRRGIIVIVLGVVLGLLGGMAVQFLGGPGYAIVGGLLGLALGLLAASLREAIDTRANAPKDVGAPAPIPVTAEAPAQPAPQPIAPGVAPPGPDPLPTSVEHGLSSARVVAFDFAALTTATADEQRAGSIGPELNESPPLVVERPIVVRPDPPKPASRFAPDPSRFLADVASAYAAAPAPAVGTQGDPREFAGGTVVNTVSVRVKKDAKEAATVPPPIRHILPAPTSSIRPRALPAARPEITDATDAADPTPERERERDPVPVAGSLLGEIGGLRRVEVRAMRQGATRDSGPNPERQARESYELRSRELERVAHDRLMREQQRLAVSIREQLAHDKRVLESMLDNRLEDTVRRPIGLPPRRAADPRFADPSGDAGGTH